MLVEKRHFDAAVKQKWATHTCLIAQVAKENDDLVEDFEGHAQIRSAAGGPGAGYAMPYESTRACQLMRVFDLHFQKPGDEMKPELQALRDSLPTDIGAKAVE